MRDLCVVPSAREVPSDATVTDEGTVRVREHEVIRAVGRWMTVLRLRLECLRRVCLRLRLTACWREGAGEFTECRRMEHQRAVVVTSWRPGSVPGDGYRVGRRAACKAD